MLALKNKKADITITLLVLGIVALCFLTIISFVKVNLDLNNNFYGVGLIETMKSVNEELKFSDISGFSPGYVSEFNKDGVSIKINDGRAVVGEYYKITGGYLRLFSSKKTTLVKVEYNK